MSNEKFTPGPWHGPEEKPLRNGYCAMRYQRLHSGRRWVFVSAQTMREIQRSAKADFPTKWLYNWHVSGLFTVISWAYVRDLENLGTIEKTPAELAAGEMVEMLESLVDLLEYHHCSDTKHEVIALLNKAKGLKS